MLTVRQAFHCNLNAVVAIGAYVLSGDTLWTPEDLIGHAERCGTLFADLRKEKKMSALSKVEAEIRLLFGGLNLDSRKALEEALADAKKELAVAQSAADTVRNDVKNDVQAGLRDLRDGVTAALSKAEPEVKAAVDAALGAGFEKILAVLA